MRVLTNSKWAYIHFQSRGYGRMLVTSFSAILITAKTDFSLTVQLLVTS